jgi:signal peptidase II
LSIIAVLLLAGMLWRIDRLDSASATGLALIFGGAMGNVFDRLRMGSVTDFLDFYAGSYHWYTFNLADASICTGAGLLILSMLRARRHESGKDREARA